MRKICGACGEEQEHKSWKSTTCEKCLETGIKKCSTCEQVLPIERFQLCRGKPIGRCSTCENKASYDKKKASGYLDRPDVREKRNASSRATHSKARQDEAKKRAAYDRHNARLKERRQTDAEYYEKVIASNRAYKDSLEGVLYAQDWQDAKVFFNNTCAYCGVDSKLTREHVIPVSQGGLNVRSNVIPACTSCNSSKYNKHMHEWYTQQKFFSKERLAKIEEWEGGASHAPKRN